MAPGGGSIATWYEDGGQLEVPVTSAEKGEASFPFYEGFRHLVVCSFSVGGEAGKSLSGEGPVCQ